MASKETWLAAIYFSLLRAVFVYRDIEDIEVNGENDKQRFRNYYN